MNTISPSILLIPIALTMALGCASEPSTASELAAVTWSAGVSDDQLAERAQLSASGLYAVPVTASLTPTPWGDALDIPEELVVEASVTGSPDASGVFNDGDLGVVRSSRGGSFVLLSTGVAGANTPVAANATKPEPGTDFLPIGVGGDTVTLSLLLRVPEGANRMSLQYNFLSAESPDFVGSQFNDTFSVQIIEGAEIRTTELASVNSSVFFEASKSRAKGSGFEFYADNPSGVDLIVSDVGLEPDAGLTGMQSFHENVTSGAELRVVFTIRDQGDGILDSAVLIDALQFTAIETLDPNPDLVMAGGALTSDLELLTTAGRHVRGAVADGVTEVVLRVEAPGPGSVTFSLLGAGAPADGGLRTLDGSAPETTVTSPVVVASGGSYALAVYRAPADFSRGAGDDSLAERSIAISAAFTSESAPGPDPGTQIDLQLRRPPVVLAHGLWSHASHWLAMPLTNDERFMITFVDHAYSCDQELRAKIPDGELIPICPLIPAGPNEGIPLCLVNGDNPIIAATKDALEKVRRLGVAATKVDLVAHGAGGIHARQYINSDDYRRPANREQGDVNRLITLNTPHFGSLMANAIVSGRGTKVDTCSVRILGPTPVDPGDIDALTTTASALLETPVPSHAMIGLGGKTLLRHVRAKLLDRVLLYSNVQPSLRLNSLFQGKDHDFFSDVDSQRGGIDAGAVSSFQLTDEPPPVDENDNIVDYFEFDAFESLKHPAISDKIVELLNSPLQPPPGEPSRFGTFAMSPTLPPAGAAAAALPPSLLPPNAAVRIVSPAHGSHVIAGSTITVEVVAENGFLPESVMVTTGRTVAIREAAPFTMTIGIPKNALGLIRLLAIGFGPDDEGSVHDSVVLIADTTASIEAVNIVTQDPNLFGAGTTRQLVVVGRYNDGATRDITASFAGTVYRSSNTGIVTVSSNGILTAVGSGVATVVVQNGGVQDSVSVTVTANERPVAAAGGAISLTCVAPGASVPVQLDGSASFDPDGDPLQLSWLENGVLLATGPTPTVELAPGVHAIELEVSDGNDTASAVVNVEILEDAAPPSVTILGEDPRSLECGAPFADDGATATDACDGDLTAAIVAHSDVDPREPGTYTVEYRVSDQAGATTVASRHVLVDDSAPPQVSIQPMRQLAPPTFRYHEFTLADCAQAIDVCEGLTDIDQAGQIVAIHSDEPDVAFFFDPDRDIAILGPSRFLLRRQNRLFRNGRVYEIEFVVGDGDGNTSATRSCFIGVKTTSGSPAPINDGRVFTVLP